MATLVFNRAVLWGLLRLAQILRRLAAELTHRTTGGTTFFPIFLNQGPSETPQTGHHTELFTDCWIPEIPTLPRGPDPHNICPTVRQALQPHANRHDGAPVNATSLPIILAAS